MGGVHHIAFDVGLHMMVDQHFEVGGLGNRVLQVLAGAVRGPKRGAAAAALYLVIGAAGVPVFSGFSGGFQKLAGVTGGYLVGYLPCAWLSGAGAEACCEKGKSRWMMPAMMAAGTAVLYIIGPAGFMIQTGNTLGGALGLCVVPFLPGDTVKIVAATLLTVPVRRAVSQINS